MAQEDVADLDWGSRLTQNIAREVRRYRQKKGLSAQQLSDRTVELGMPIQRSVLANLESGRRTTVTVAEVLVLAAALGVPPGVLIFPVGFAQHCENLPGSFPEPIWAIEWLSGRAILGEEEVEEYAESPLGLIRTHEERMEYLMRAIRRRDQAREEFSQQSEEDGDALRRYDLAMAELKEIGEQMRRLNESIKAGGHVDYDYFRDLKDEHDRIYSTVQMYQSRAAQYRYARDRVERLEEQVVKAQGRLLESRKEIKARGLVPPLLFKKLMYLDPDAPVALDDMDKRREMLPEALEVIPTASDVDEVDIEAPENSTELSGAPGRLSESDAIEIMNELRPHLKREIAAAFSEVLREYGAGES
ncbi:helix-turn-helix domain-containing protein [Streptomyces sp. NPDC051310]|uniref:helix-turn-helix domain-containing protein n=1 Tax=Streptomyces sp. NPDC051310 TaxID=3365649 RepID=UPI00378C635E